MLLSLRAGFWLSKFSRHPAGIHRVCGGLTLTNLTSSMQRASGKGSGFTVISSRKSLVVLGSDALCPCEQEFGREGMAKSCSVDPSFT